MVHQHGIGQAALFKRTDQMLLHQLALGPLCGSKPPPRNDCDRRLPTRPLRPSAVLRSLEVHLPKLVGALTLEALDGGRVPVLLPHQAVAQKHTMDGAGRQPDALAIQQHGQLARAPVRVNLAQGPDARLQLSLGLRG